MAMRVVTFLTFLFVVANTASADQKSAPLIQATSDAIATAVGRLQTGEMRLEYHWEWHRFDHQTKSKPCLTTQDVIAHVTWKDDNWHADYTIQEVSRYKETGAIETGDNELKHVEELRDPKFQLKLFSGQNGNVCYLRTARLVRSEKYYIHFFDPRKAWFCPDDFGGYQHLERLKQRPEETFTVVRDVPKPRQYRIENRSKDGHRQSFVVDLGQGGMVIESQTMPKKCFWTAGKWNWRQDSHGVWYADQITIRSTKEDAPDELMMEHTVKVTSFDSQPKIAANRFLRSSIKLPQGTYMDEISASGRKKWYVGGKLPEPGVNLDQLIDDAQSGFAAPKEKP